MKNDWAVDVIIKQLQDFWTFKWHYPFNRFFADYYLRSRSLLKVKKNILSCSISVSAIIKKQEKKNCASDLTVTSPNNIT